MTLLAINDLHKHFGAVHALRGVNLNVEPGAIGLLGRNGAGKSTLLKCALGVLKPSQGSMSVMGLDPLNEGPAIRTKVGFMPEGQSVLSRLTALDYVTLAAQLSGMPRDEATARAHQVLNYVGLGEVRNRALGTFSTGLRQRARFAQALVSDPQLLVLDEPTAGLDPSGRQQMLSLISDVAKRPGASVILSTHILRDVEQTCDTVIVLAEGQVTYAGAIQTLLAATKHDYDVIVTAQNEAFERGLEEAGCVIKMRGAKLRLSLPDAARADLVLRVAHATGARVRHVAPLARTLEHAITSDPIDTPPPA